MKNLKSILMVFVLVIGMNAFAGNEKAVIKTSAQCEMCQEKLETSIGDLPGVLKVMLEIESKDLVVKFNNDLISLDEIKTAVNNTGYWADDKAPNKEAYAALDACCKPKASCCASKTSCSKETAAKKECSKDGAAKKECSKDGEKKACCADGAKKEGSTKSSCNHAH